MRNNGSFASPSFLSRRSVRGVLLLAALVLLGLAIAPRAGASIYWGNAIGGGGSAGTTIGRANNDGTAVNQTFIGGASQPTAVAVDAAHIYWLNDVGRSIGRANLDGTGVNQNFITGVNTEELAVDGGHIYWADIDSQAIGRANLDGTGVNHNFITGAQDPQGVAVDSQHVYWTNSEIHAIGRANLDGTSVNQTLITGLGDPVEMAVDAAHIYWTDLVSSGIGRANLDGTGVNQNFIQGAVLPFGVAVDSAHVYWTNQFPSPDGATGGAIGRANLDGTGVNQTLITGLHDPFGVAVDAAAQAAQPSRISIGDVSMAEGNSGQTAFRFTVSLDRPQAAPVTVGFATANGTATASSDYAAATGTVTFAPGETAKPVTVQVNGDTTVEPDETFNVNLANATGNATIIDATAVGKIVNDDQPPAPVVNSTSPANGATGVTATASAYAVFSEAMDHASTAGAFSLRDDSSGQTVPGTVVFFGDSVPVLVPSAGFLHPGDRYTASISTAAKAANGTRLASPVSWSFTVAANPIVQRVAPTAGATGVSPNSTVYEVFSQPMNEQATQAAFSLKNSSGNSVAGSFAWFGPTVMIFTPSSALSPGTVYTASVSTAARDQSGNPLAAAKSWSFTTTG